MASNAAEYIIQTLIASGIKRVYGLPGDSLNGITDAIRTHKGIDWIHVRHEEVAAFAAGAEAHLTGSLVVCAGSCGPGNLHLINGLFDCHRSRVPVLAIATQVPSAELGTNYFQETHPETLFRDCSHYCVPVSNAEHVPRILRIAMRSAIAMRGVAVVVIPGDVLLSECSADADTIDTSAPMVRMLPSKAKLAEAATVLNDASAVTILAGAGCADAHAKVMAIAEQLKAPVVHALRGKEFLDYDNPYNAGMTGLLGYPSGYHAVMDCDALLMLGTDFPYTQFYPEKAKILQVDIRGEQIGRRTHVDVSLVGTVSDTIDAMLPMLALKTKTKHLDDVRAQYVKSRENFDSQAVGPTGHTPIHPQYLTTLVSNIAAQDGVFTCDVGTPTTWAARYLTMNGSRRLVGSFAHGSMANAVPQAIGAQVTFPTRQVVALSGDGGLAMLLGDLLTLKQMKLPVKIIVYNNSALSFVELEMKAAGILEFGTDLENPSFAAVAEACGLFGVRVENPEDLPNALDRAFAYDGPALVDVVVNRQELSMPPSIELKQATGFGIYVMRAIMNGRGDEVIDLAKSNLFR
jgi:pyruvate dehydrogenase (quinone)